MIYVFIIEKVCSDKIVPGCDAMHSEIRTDVSGSLLPPSLGYLEGRGCCKNLKFHVNFFA